MMIIFCVFGLTLKAQVFSNNGNHSYNYVGPFTVLTSAGDSVYTGNVMVEGITNRGNLYSKIKHENYVTTVYYCPPWVENNAIFVEYDKTGKFKQSLIFQSIEDKRYYSYYFGERFKNGEVTKNDYSDALSLWK